MSDAQESDHLICRPSCGACGRPATYVELVPPGAHPAAWDTWSPRERQLFDGFRDPTTWRFLFRGIVAGNGFGDDLSAEEAARYLTAFSEPLTFQKVHGAGLYDDAGFCEDCDQAYWSEHWHVSAGGFGNCPRGHGKSLDPHWSPDDYA